MSDKLRQGVAVIPEFVAGETPSAAKFTSISVQLRTAAEQLEKAVGDITGGSWPYSSNSLTTLSLPRSYSLTANTVLANADERFLDIANIARLIGPASNLNSRSLPSLGARSITENVPLGVREFSTQFPISSGTPTFSDAVVFVTNTTKENLAVVGEWAFDSAGRVWTAGDTNGGTITYSTNPATYNGGLSPQASTFNVIPDPNQITAGGAGLSFGAVDGSGRYPVTLPVCTHQQSGVDGLSVVLDAADPTYNRQLQLPVVLQNNFLAGEEIPSGFILLKNLTTNEAYTDATYYYSTATVVLVGGVDLDDEISDGDDFVFITIGSDITTSIDDLRVKSFHAHDRTHGEPLIEAANISGLTGPSSTHTVGYGPSEIEGNHMPQYLHRDGWVDGVDDNVNKENVMRGDLAIGTATAGGGLASTGNSYKVLFTDDDDIYIRREDLGITVNVTGDLDSRLYVKGDDSTNGYVKAHNGFIGRIGNRANTTQIYSIESGLTSVYDTNDILVEFNHATLGFTPTPLGLTGLLLPDDTSYDEKWYSPSDPTFQYTLRIDTSAAGFTRIIYNPGPDIPLALADEGATINITFFYKVP